jgi:Asp-tRNA(Asn)/Glu-tRNA(Gln) amidotransferase A subunit family amidase
VSDDVLLRPAHAIAAAVNRRETSARAVTEAALDRIAATDTGLGAFTDLTVTRALDEADAVDARMAAGEALPLAGVPYAVKNLFDVEGVVTRAGSLINRDDPAGRCRRDAGRPDAGGRRPSSSAASTWANTPTTSPARTATTAPRSTRTTPARMSGGSSGRLRHGGGERHGRGLARLRHQRLDPRARLILRALRPEADLRPPFPRRHLSVLREPRPSRPARPLRHRPRPDARRAPGRRPGRPGPGPAPASCGHGGARQGDRGLRIAVAGGYFRDPQWPAANAAVEAVAAALGVSRDVEIPEAARARAAAYVITNAEAATLHLPRLRTRAADFDPDVRDRLLSGAMLPAQWLVQAQRFRAWFRDAMRDVFRDVDVILAPATPFPAPESGTKTVVIDGVTLPLRPNIGIFTQPISFIGLPVVSVPVWPADGGLPVGVQVIAPAWREDLALRVAHHLETAGVATAPVAALPA